MASLVGLVWVVVQAGREQLQYPLPEMTAMLLADNLRRVREWDEYEAEAAAAAADRIQAALDGEIGGAIGFTNEERLVVVSSLDALLAGAHGSPTMLALTRALMDEHAESVG